MKKISFLGLLIVVSAFLISCATGTALITGKQREAISPETVIIYTEEPAEYETIGIVTASSEWGWTEQDSLNYAVEELKNQAAKIGANGILLQSVDTVSEGGVFVYGVYVPVSAKSVSGKAIYVEAVE